MDGGVGGNAILLICLIHCMYPSTQLIQSVSAQEQFLHFVTICHSYSLMQIHLWERCARGDGGNPVPEALVPAQPG